MTFFEAIKSVFSNYANFSGRARRSEYWYFVLFNVIVGAVLSSITAAVVSNLVMRTMADVMSSGAMDLDADPFAMMSAMFTSMRGLGALTAVSSLVSLALFIPSLAVT